MIDQLAKQVFSDFNKMFGDQEQVPASQFKAMLESGLKRLNLVSREEFDAQQAVLERTREKLEQLEKRMAEIEQP